MEIKSLTLKSERRELSARSDALTLEELVYFIECMSVVENYDRQFYRSFGNDKELVERFEKTSRKVREFIRLARSFSKAELKEIEELCFFLTNNPPE
jgi:hypothetical protein